MRNLPIGALAVIAAVLLVGCACVPYAPDTGTFINSPPAAVTFNPVTTTATTVSPYSISLNGSQVVVVKTNITVAKVDVPAGWVAWYLFYGPNKRFLALDLRTAPSTPPPISMDYQQYVVDLEFGPSQGNALTQKSFLSPFPQLHFYPSPGNSLAFLFYYGLPGGQIQDAGVYRSDNASQLCFAPSFTSTVQVEAKITTTSFEILDGGTAGLKGLSVS